MTFHELRKYLHNFGPQMVQWGESGIVEQAKMMKNGAVRITNVATRKSYILPKGYECINLRIVDKNEMVILGSLLPKGKR